MEQTNLFPCYFLFFIFVATFLIIFPIVTVQKFLIGGLRQRLETTKRFHWKSELSAKPQDVENHRRHFYSFTYVLYSSSCVIVCVRFFLFFF